jgi:hypothetical protein
VGAPPTDHRTQRVRGDAVAGGGSGDKVLLGWPYEHEQRTVNPPDKERTAEAHRGQPPTVRGKRRWQLR